MQVLRWRRQMPKSKRTREFAKRSGVVSGVKVRVSPFDTSPIKVSDDPKERMKQINSIEEKLKDFQKRNPNP